MDKTRVRNWLISPPRVVRLDLDAPSSHSHRHFPPSPLFAGAPRLPSLRETIGLQRRLVFPSESSITSRREPPLSSSSTSITVAGDLHLLEISTAATHRSRSDPRNTSTFKTSKPSPQPKRPGVPQRQRGAFGVSGTEKASTLPRNKTGDDGSRVASISRVNRLNMKVAPSPPIAFKRPRRYSKAEPPMMESLGVRAPTRQPLTEL
ncbi:hypothetical protein IGI04_036262 [Brassica rapa subsp. trilocularis]|uniref:Uncharacterized protein n=1 Tax=Brassica rapa subsp. trilocularis TaxID=1813537 RepID=A0ABQ7LEY2_BRACM|nr:hypothetical protein IGI04_036262 [Brassica rapa subsp. trilocularis]